MSLPASIPTAVIETIVLRLLSLFLPGANGDAVVARHTARHMLATFNPRNEQELCLAADIISFDLHALEALSQSDDPDIPPARALRLRSGAVSLTREARRARQELRQMQQAAPQATPEEPHAMPAEPQAAVAEPGNRAEAAVDLVEEARKMIAAASKDAKQGRHAGLTYSQALQKRMTTQRLLDKQKRRAAEQAARLVVPSGPRAAMEAAPPA